ncbi:hypothetical protein A1Q2_08486 [Trichosporon asahii var. asahii CBS 8904]|uniref:Ricin B lectin domain-containing protein n=1 Tax=Trichosporon asahii var. asahii (strain CBS 8904) TaxID=1220162 RepID=K1UZZ1_TRIAC|nr:hypothetical protein A1Q2_08486 [Trichosporon asahii var. asahii CBS 8904]
MLGLSLTLLVLASQALADWTVTISPKSDPSRCFTSTGVGNPVKILPCDSSESQKWTTWEGCGSLIWQSSTGKDMILQAGYRLTPDWPERAWQPKAGSVVILNSTWTRPDTGMTFLRKEGHIENTFADQFVGYNQCLDWKDGAGEVLQLWNCVEGNSNQQFDVRYA